VPSRPRGLERISCGEGIPSRADSAKRRKPRFGLSVRRLSLTPDAWQSRTLDTSPVSSIMSNPEGPASSFMYNDPSTLTPRAQLLLSPTWMDLFLWAVITGDHQLARGFFISERRLLLEPLRAAILAARFCRENIHSRQGLYSEELESLAGEYEGWASGLLDHVPTEQEAHRLLTQICTRTRTRKGRVVIVPWRCSVLDEAIRGDRPCRNFVAHRHCQVILSSYFEGDFHGSSLCLPPLASYFSVLREIFIQLLQLLTLGTWVAPAHGLLHTILKVPNRGHEHHAKGKQPVETDAFSRSTGKSFFGEVFHGPAVYHGPADRSAECGKTESGGNGAANGGESSSSESELDADCFEEREESEEYNTFSRRIAGAAEAWRRFVQFMAIPQVRFVFYSLFVVVHLVLMAMVGAGPFPSFVHWTYMHRSGVWHDYADPRYREAAAIETLMWLCCLSYAVDEDVQIGRSLRGLKEYLSSGWNQLDLLSNLSSFVAFGFRLASLIQFTTGGVDPAYTSPVEQGYRATLAIAIIFRFSRSSELLAYSPYIGEYVYILALMTSEAIPILIMILIAVATFGTAFSTLDTIGSQNPETMNRPLMRPLWAIVGDISMENYYEDMGTNMLPVYPALLFIYTFLTTIFLVNMLTAQMTSTFEAVKAESSSHRLFQKVHLIEEFKDHHRVPLPFNLVDLYSVVRALSFLKLYQPFVRSCFKHFGLYSSSNKEEHSSRSFSVVVGRDESHTHRALLRARYGKLVADLQKTYARQDADENKYATAADVRQLDEKVVDRFETVIARLRWIEDHLAHAIEDHLARTSGAVTDVRSDLHAQRRMEEEKEKEVGWVEYLRDVIKVQPFAGSRASQRTDDIFAWPCLEGLRSVRAVRPCVPHNGAGR